MDLLVVASIAGLALLALTLLVVGRWLWRLFRENEEPVAGGSVGRQAFGPRHDDTMQDRN